MPLRARRGDELQPHLHLGLSHAGGGGDGGGGAGVHVRERARVRAPRRGGGTRRQRAGAAAVVLLRRVHRSVRGGRQVPGGAAAVGAPHEAAVRRGGRRLPAAVPHPDRRVGPHPAAGAEKTRAGGAARAIERGVFQQAIARSAYEQQKAIESGGAVVVGVNEYTDEQPIPTVPAPDYSALAAAQQKRLGELRAKRDGGAVQRALRDLEAAARDGAAPLMEPIIVAVRARATVGEISDVLRGVWGVYRPA